MAIQGSLTLIIILLVVLFIAAVIVIALGMARSTQKHNEQPVRTDTTPIPDKQERNPVTRRDA